MNSETETKRRFSVASSPHIASPDSTPNLMLDVLIALLPAWLVAVYFFGFRVVSLTAVTIAAAVGAEYLYRRLTTPPPSPGCYSPCACRWRPPTGSPPWAPCSPSW